MTKPPAGERLPFWQPRRRLPKWQSACHIGSPATYPHLGGRKYFFYFFYFFIDKIKIINKKIIKNFSISFDPNIVDLIFQPTNLLGDFEHFDMLILHQHFTNIGGEFPRYFRPVGPMNAHVAIGQFCQELLDCLFSLFFASFSCFVRGVCHNMHGSGVLGDDIHPATLKKGVSG